MHYIFSSLTSFLFIPVISYQRKVGGNQITSIDDEIQFAESSVTYKSDLSYTNTGSVSNITRTRTSDNAKFNDVTYTYDNAGRIKTEKNTVFGKEYLYEYDTNNNIKYVTEYNTNGTIYNKQTYNYSYDRLTSITNSNFSIGTRNYTTDALGNHINYSGFNLSWTRGRLLENITDSVGTSVSFKYDDNGIRYQKSLTNSAGASYNVNYYLDGTKIIAEERNGVFIDYFYNQTGVIGMRLNGKNFLFLKDALGSITEIIDENGGLYAQYVYDAWGNTVYKSTGGLTDINPFRYRGYYMDTETGWYYLQTRYYDPVVRRFINADNYELIPYLASNIGELNLYSYCNNNPVMYTDETGEGIILAIATTLLVGAVIGGIAGGITALATGQNIWAGVAGGAISGLISTAGMALAITTGGVGGLAIAGLAGFAAGSGGSAITQGIGNGWGNINLREVLISGVISAAVNMATFGMMNFAMRESVGLFDNIFDKSLKFGTRLANSLALLATGMFSAPMTAVNMFVDIARYYGSGNTYGDYYSRVFA